ncbi:MAG: GlmU family protein [Flavobacteriales bacterium]|nr:GlmU family protein [Flavobacteriales bacterium]
MKICLFDDKEWDQLLPLTYTRSVSDVRVGILTLREKWEKRSGMECSVYTRAYLQNKYPSEKVQGEYLLINSACIATAELFHAVFELKKGQQLEGRLGWIAKRGEGDPLNDHATFETVIFKGTEARVSFPWDVFSLNRIALEEDFELLTHHRVSQMLSSTNTVIGNGKIFLEEGARVEACILNATDGPIYLGKDAEIMEGSMIRGGLALGEHSTLKLGTKIYGPTTIGPHCKVGGEISNSVIFGYSNKAHDGFLGNSVLGEWCNLGADTNNSNLKNNYGMVKAFSPAQAEMISTGLQFCGLIMGDHSKSGINTMFNTGTVVGVNANVFGGGFPPKHIPSFFWGGADGFETFELERSFDVSQRVMSRRSLSFTDTDREIMRHIFNVTAKFRS